jgi:DNA-binding transcriptional MerR regulator
MTRSQRGRFSVDGRDAARVWVLMPLTVAVQPGLKSTVFVALISIGEAARILGMNTSALRYYEERGLIAPAARHGGRRMYDTDQLRRLALVQIMQQLGIPLDAAGSILDESSDVWREHLSEQLQHLDDLIARATLAREFLARAQRCRADHPVAQCPKLGGIIDRRLSGVSFDQLVREHTVKPLR